MKKHFLRILAVMLMACLGLGVMAACGDKEEPPVTYTVAFSLGESHAAAGVTAPASQTGKAAGDTVALTAPEAEEGWKFDGWYTKSGKVDGAAYTVKAADAEGDTITLTAHWAEDPEPSYDIEGVWSGDIGMPANVTIDVDGNAAHFVMAMNMGEGYFYYYMKFTLVSGVYTCEEGEQAGATITLNEDGNLVYGSGLPEQSMTFTTKTALPASLNITGTKYTAFHNKLLAFDFGAAPAITYGGTAVTGVTAINVGEYKVLTCNMTYMLNGNERERSVTFIIYESQSENYAYVVTPGEAGERCALGDEEPTYRVLFAAGDAGSEVRNMPSETRKFKIGEKYTIPTQEPTWENHIFKGWLETIDGQALVGDTLYKTGGRVEFTFGAADVKFVAQWEADYPPSGLDTAAVRLGAHPAQGESATVQLPAIPGTPIALPAVTVFDRGRREP